MSDFEVTTKPPKEAILPIKSIQIISLEVYIVLLLLSLFFWPSVDFVVGLSCGFGIAFFNLRFMKVLLDRLDGEMENMSANWGLFFVLKFFALIMLTGILILVIKVHALAFVFGYATMLVGLLFYGIKSMLTPKGE